ncbi:hypothetical protein J6590_068297 [Homalodisca vitripennis]|nr:hypothetical protein J6590_068297 [Homalodisca vitripennis]
MNVEFSSIPTSTITSDRQLLVVRNPLVFRLIVSSYNCNKKNKTFLTVWCPTAGHHQAEPMIPWTWTWTSINIYRHLEGFIADRQANAKFVIATLPHRYDLHPDLPVHDETVLVNAYIEELAARYNARVLNLGGIGRNFFPRHGQHPTMRGKRLLARMIVRVASERPLRNAGATDLAIPTVSSSPTISQVPAAVNPQHQHSGRLQHISYAEALRKYPVLDSGDKFGSAAAVPRGVNGAQAASMSPRGGVLAGATEASELTRNRLF